MRQKISWRHLGCRTHWEQSQGSKVLCIHSEGPFVSEIPDQLMREMRSSIVFLGAMIARCGQAKLSYPGGCELGPRPIDLHLSSLKKLGVTIREDGGYLDCIAPKGLHAAQITLPFPSVGATENIMIAASMAQGETVIQNAAREPEILDLAGFLNAAEPRCASAGWYGCHRRRQAAARRRYRVIPDRIVAVTYLCCCAVAKGELLLRGVRPDHLSAVLPLLEEMGCQLKTEKDTIRIVCRQPLRAVSGISTMPYPGFPTDALAPMMAAACTAQGTTIFIENIFQDRFKHAWELCRMGADIKAEGRVAVVRGCHAALCAGSMYRPARRSGAGRRSAGRPRKNGGGGYSPSAARI